ncbi:MAG: hypothetical protein A2W90_03940 [Bacteroidetes bacterium GWF2_42_66]|nr:MAG: hypothetical protein A2W92_06525 [Bacteroidetes bacterium GWA2_42_15]OFY02524.1 MAG: hypothetical protein A2W89_21915 [Bacteroidetes bacterium GWE2_42_39]OFY41378.1 MAG: hypothetical protein A2W90_03940 [Bacteroidetes bacterium GWF2_42_66]HBL75421.1 hypothetical protein [Prolixibacteraceae bacterium]HCR91313.1 hypothetical protein [Prolixibacteraceae bacterium]
MKLRLKLAHWALNRKAGKLTRKTEVHNFDTAKTVAVLWSFDESDAFGILQRYLQTRKNMSVTSLYFNSEKKANTEDGKSFSKAQLSWLGFPKEGPAIGLLQQKTDLLIDLTVKKKFPLQAVASLSGAAFKVGFGADDYNPYDLNIDIQNKPEPTYLAEQIINYLNQINKKEA